MSDQRTGSSRVQIERPSTRHLDGPLEFESLLLDLSSRFINLPIAELDGEIEGALRRVCDFLGLDLAVLWQWSVANPDIITATHAYSGLEGVQSPEEFLQEQFPWFRGQMQAGHKVSLSSPEDLPVEAVVDRESCYAFGIKSNLTLALMGGGEQPLGALGFNTLQVERDWPEAVVNRLQLVAQILTNALTRKRHELTLVESEARLAAGAELAGLGFYEVDFGQGSAYVDERMRDLCGLPQGGGRDLRALEFWIEHLHPDDHSRVMHMREQLHDGRLDQVSVEYRFLHPAEGQRWFRHQAQVAQRDAGGRALVSFGVLRDITEQRRASDDLRSLSQRLIRAHEEERALLARELHDDVTQRLAVLAIDVGLAERAVPNGAQTQSAMRTIREELVRLSEDIHSLAYQLHPSVLEELGLGEALRTECERVGRRSQLDLSVELDPLPAVVGKDAALCLFRVAQEALNNVIRHAGARAASASLRQVDGGLLLIVRDDGIGFDPANSGVGRSLGLASMRERVRLVGGRLDIESAPDQGTAIVAWIPAGEAPQ